MRRPSLVGFIVILLMALAACGQPAAPPPAEPTAISTMTAVPALTPTAATAPTPTATPASSPTPVASEEQELVVFAVAPFTEVFERIGDDFESEHRNVSLTFNFAGGPQLAQQLNQGATADVLAFNEKGLPLFEETGRVISTTVHTFTRSRPVIVVPADNPAQISSLPDLAQPDIAIVLGSEETAIGQYSHEFLDKAAQDSNLGPAYRDAVLANVVSYETSVRAVLAKIIIGEADAAIVYASDVARNEADKVQRIDIPADLVTDANFQVTSISDSAQPDLAQQFSEYLRSPAAQTVLVEYGFISTTGNATGGAPVAGPLTIEGLVDSPLTLTLDDLKQLEQTTITATDRDGVATTYTGVPITAVLEAAGITDAATQVVFTGGDGYSQTVSLEDLRADGLAIIAFMDDGSLRNIIPSLQPRYWVKGLVKLDVE